MLKFKKLLNLGQAARARNARVAVTAAVAVAALSLTGCGGSGQPSSTGGGGQKYTIGVSNATLSQAVRVQLMDSIQKTAQEYIDKGTLNPLVIENADTDSQGQVRQVQNLINRGVNAIIIDPSSDTALKPILAQAEQRGIKVVAVDNSVDDPQAAQVSVDFPGNFRADADWVMKQMGGKGSLLRVDGIAGVPANQMGIDAVTAALKENPNVKLAATLNGNWDTATAVQVTSSWLASGNKPDGVWSTGGGVAYGVLQSFVSAGTNPLPPINGEATAGWLRLAAKVKTEHPDFKFFVGNLIQPAAQGQAGVHVAMGLLQGKNLKDNKITLPRGEITAENFDKYVDLVKDVPDANNVDVNNITQDQALSLWFR
ncbi:substrate-binding domain-containing protein [Arthrobacter globiformis]|uniref:substrate-binding domain-containing protein n=1 Tax=Arthrobacter globiformis TaxID=1665 RepID=UPI0027872772|nr:substrate-binding domain-containing protein [Arthrobacter globiformis]MDQ0867344.1 ribose transport system substrate-binding protein [Arthrobacter globiformis]